MRQLIPLVLALACLSLMRVAAEDASPPIDPSVPAYTPHRQVSGELVLWGDDAFEKQMAVWAPAFRAKQPNLQVRWFLKGTSTAIGALYTGTAQIGLYGREIRPLEITAWKRIFPYEPLGFSIATGGYKTYNGTNAVAVFVNKDNPLQHLSLTQLDAIYSRKRRRGAPTAIRTWGQLGLTGEWAARPITVYGLDEPTGTAQFMQSRVLRDGPWAYDIKLPKGAPDKMYAGSGNAAAIALVKALAKDPGAIGLASFYNADPAIRALPIGETDAGPFVEGTEATVLNRTYPLSRLVYLFVNKDPRRPWDPKVYEFIQFVLSRDGQAGVAEVNTYHPLPAALLVHERLKLGSDDDRTR